MLRKYQNLIGYELTGENEFGDYGRDSYQVYTESLKTQPNDWYYRTNRVFYNRNSFGHRSCEPCQLTKDFIMFVGCSNSVGTAVRLEDTFPCIVANKLGKTYYNLSVEGSGYDLISYNINAWFSMFDKPSVVVINWPQISRTFRIDGENVIPIGPWSQSYTISKTHWDNYASIITTDYFEHYSEILRQSIVTFLQLQKIKVIEVDKYTCIDYGRDLKHPGISTHLQITNQILTKT
jgi:hypothetical protein